MTNSKYDYLQNLIKTGKVLSVAEPDKDPKEFALWVTSVANFRQISIKDLEIEWLKFDDACKRSNIKIPGPNDNLKMIPPNWRVRAGEITFMLEAIYPSSRQESTQRAPSPTTTSSKGQVTGIRSEKFAFLVAVEKYAEPTISNVIYAEADLIGLSQALEDLGFEPSRQTKLINNGATKNIIQSRLKKLLKSLTAEDQLIIYYAGHGFSQSDVNYITCHDTQPGDLADTSIELREIFRAMETSSCKKIIMFLDSCESGMPTPPTARRIHSHLTDTELEKFFKESEFRVCFAACKVKESSYPSNTLKHGIWTYHLIEALRGEAPHAHDNGQVLASTLQTHLKIEVSRTLRAAYNTQESQTPWFYGSMSNDFLVADISEILKKRAVAAKIGAKPPFAEFRVLEVVKTTDLKGFKPGNHAPKESSDYTRSLVARWGEADVLDRIETLWESCRQEFGYKRKDKTPTKYQEGWASLILPDFKISVGIEQDLESPRMATLTILVDEIKDPYIVMEESFNNVFLRRTNSIRAYFGTDQNIEDLIDRIEEIDSEDLSVTYPPDNANCDIKLSAINLEVHVEEEYYEIYSANGKSPKELVEQIFEMQREIARLSLGNPIVAFLNP